jgi:cell division protein FtsL
MATLARVFHKHEIAGPGGTPARRAGAPVDTCALRALPQEDVFFFCKKIDNSRLVREPDPKAGGTCWSVIGAACLAVLLLTAVGTVKVSTTMSGYKLEDLRAEERRLVDEGRALDLQEAELLSPERLERLAKEQNLVTPSAGKVFRLDNTRPDGTVAMVK